MGFGTPKLCVCGFIVAAFLHHILIPRFYSAEEGTPHRMGEREGDCSEIHRFGEKAHATANTDSCYDGEDTANAVRFS